MAQIRGGPDHYRWEGAQDYTQMAIELDVYSAQPDAIYLEVLEDLAPGQDEGHVYRFSPEGGGPDELAQFVVALVSLGVRTFGVDSWGKAHAKALSADFETLADKGLDVEGMRD